MRISPEILTQCWFLAGPTAVGKSAASLQLAEQLGAEILSLDSMAIYRGMTIGTAKPSSRECARIPHHLIDLVNPWEEFSVAEYLVHADRHCREILARGRVPLFVGGTGLYLRSLLRGVFDGPPADEQLRARLEQHYNALGGIAFHQELAALDAPAARRIHPRDRRRLVRAREVFELTGKRFSSFHEEQPLPREQRPEHVYWLHPPREWLYDRINIRVEQMLAEGLIDEVATLRALPHPLGKTARQAIGYKELLDAFEQQSSLEEAIELIKTRSRRLAKRQHTWFRNLEECRAIPLTGQESPAELVALLLD